MSGQPGHKHLPTDHPPSPKGKQFLIENDKKSGIFVFAMEKISKFLGKSATMLWDGTIECWPVPYEQIYVMSGQTLPA